MAGPGTRQSHSLRRKEGTGRFPVHEPFPKKSREIR